MTFSSMADSWVPKANFGGTPRWGINYFTINGKAYVGMGIDATTPYNYRTDMWEFDPVTNLWTQVADFAGIPRYTGVAFSIGSKGYIGTGKSHSSTIFFDDMWQYDPQSNAWTQKNDFPAPARQAPVSVKLNDKIYAGFGRTPNSFLSDWYCYNDTTDIWTPVASFPGAARGGAIAFEINDIGYVGPGMTSYANPWSGSNDFWAYDPSSNLWIQKANLPGPSRFNAIGFAINNKGYAGNGSMYTVGMYNVFTDFYEYDPVFDTWISKAAIPSDNIYSGGFSLGNKGYIACGIDSIFNLFSLVWEYTPDDATSMNEFNSHSNQMKIYPNPVQDVLHVSDCSGEIISIFSTMGSLVGETIVISGGTEQSINVTYLKPGIYFVKSSSQVVKIFKE